MKKSIRNKMLSSVLAISCMTSALPAIMVSAEDSAPAVENVYATDFEDGDVSHFSKRGDSDTSVIAAATGEAHSGTGYMSVTGRSKNWNGPQIRIDDICEPGVKYSVSAWVKSAWYNDCKLSMQYTDANGEAHYSNLSKATSDGNWVQIPEIKFSYSADMKDVYLYIECNDAVDLSVDDFAIKTTPNYQIQNDIVSLKEAYQNYFKIGGAVTADELSPQTTKDLILKHYNSLTLGNELKPENMLDQAGCQAAGDNTTVAVNLNGAARTILDFCRDNQIPVRGHVLVWHSQTPGWFFKENYSDDGDFVDKETMLARMENYIKGVMDVLAKEYPDVDFYAWDVVNEAWLDDGKPRNPGIYDPNSGKTNDSGWTAVFGDNSFIPYAFEYARKYAPEGCKLYYNDFNEYMPQKTDAIVQMATELKEKGLIDGIGMQSHLDVTFPGISAYEKAVKKFAETGLDIQVTELDATTADTSEEGFETQAKYYSDIMDVLVNYADNISAVVFWGTTDDMSWRNTKCPLLFNEDYTAKPAFYSIVDGLEVPEPTETEATESTEPSETEATESSEKTVLLGDVDENGKINVLDVIEVNRAILGKTVLTAEQEKAADINLNGSPDSTDALNIMKCAIGLIEQSAFPIQ